MPAPARSRLTLAKGLAGTASTYWLGIFPTVNREAARWRARAGAIPDPRWRARAGAIPDGELRRLALATQAGERGNLEGAGAFAVLAPRARREAVARAAVCFQALYDYVDTLAEQAAADRQENGRALHRALAAALAPGRVDADYYEHFHTGRDGGYIAAMVQGCREALRTLPGHQAIAAGMLQAAERMAVFQSLNHAETGQRQERLRRWAESLTPTGSGLRWWETAAGAASSLEIFALIAAAGQANVSRREAAALHAAYFPWIGALHVLLDSLIDRSADIPNGHHSLVAHYRDPAEAAGRLRQIADRSVAQTRQLSNDTRHAMLLAAMSSFYLSRPGARSAEALGARREVLDAIGPLAAPTMAILRLRHAAERLLTPWPTKPPGAHGNPYDRCYLKLK